MSAMPHPPYADISGRLARQAGERRKAQAHHRLLDDFSSDAVMCMGFDGRRRYVSPAFCRMTGWSKEEALARDDLVLVHPADQDAVAQVATKLQAGSLQASCAFRYVCKDGSVLWVEGCFQVASARHGFGPAYAGSIRDIMDRRRLEAQLAAAHADLTRLSATDALIPLASRRHLDHALAAEWARGIRDEQPLSLLLLDADHFDAYNDTYGSQARDEVLRIIAACVHCGPCRTTDVTARYGGEAFAVLMPHTDGFGAMMMAEQIRDAVLDRNLPHLGSPCGIVSVSVGVATVVPYQERDAAVLVGKAEAALGQAKLLGRNRIEADEAVVAAAATAGGWYGAPDNTARKPR